MSFPVYSTYCLLDQTKCVEISHSTNLFYPICGTRFLYFTRNDNYLKLKKIGKHKWNYNYEKHQIEYLFTFEKDYSFGNEEGLALSKGEKIEIFRSKKYQRTGPKL